MSDKYFEMSEIEAALNYGYALTENGNSPIVESALVTCNQSIIVPLDGPYKAYAAAENNNTRNGAAGLRATDIVLKPESFGVCKVSGEACKPEIEGNKWQECDETHRISGEASVTMDSYMVCLKGGIISPFTDGQRIEELMGENFPEYVTLEQLKQLGWHEPNAKSVFELNRVLEKYDITTTERIRHLLAQCMKESNKGMWIREGDNTDWSQEKLEEYYNNTSYGYKYRGVGYIHMTWESAYLSFATYMIQQEYPELNIEWNPPYRTDSGFMERYQDAVEKAEGAGYNIEKYKKIVEEGADYVALEYAWEVTGYYWYAREVNKTVDMLEPGNKEDVDKVSKIVNRDDEETFGERQDFYEETLSVIK